VVDIIEIDLREIGWDGMDWIDLAQDRGPLEGSRGHGNEPTGSINCWKTDTQTCSELLLLLSSLLIY
jgi:hypothetical protein